MKDVAVNRTSWDARVPIHLRSPLYRRQIDKLRRGEDCLSPVIAERLGDIRGLRVVHLQCHIGTDTLALAQRGAEVIGLDFSEPAVVAARELAAELDLPARFVVADVLRADQVLEPGTFDMVFASEGVACWIRDMDRWMQVAANLLKPGGRLFFQDGHPVADIFEDDPAAPDGISVRYGYFDRQPLHFGPGPSYASREGEPDVPETVEFNHSVSELINAAIAAGLRIEHFGEHPQCYFRKYAVMRQEPEVWTLPGELRGKLPMQITIDARKRV